MKILIVASRGRENGQNMEYQGSRSNAVTTVAKDNLVFILYENRKEFKAHIG